jgi:hypothetical protein
VGVVTSFATVMKILSKTLEFFWNKFLVNPAIILKNWNSTVQPKIKRNGKVLESGKHYKAGFENSADGTNLVLWFNYESKETTNFEIIQ